MKEDEKQSHCGTCEYNVNNYCTSHHGYYFHGEAISDEEVECEDWMKNVHAYPFLIREK